MNITPPNPLKIFDTTTVEIDGKPNAVLSIICNTIGVSVELALFLVFLRGCCLPVEEMRSMPIQGTVVYSESLDDRTKFGIDLDGNMDTIERTFYVNGIKFSNVAKPGDKILYQERRNYLAKPKKNMPANSIKQIGNDSTTVEKVEPMMEKIIETSTQNIK